MKQADRFSCWGGVIGQWVTEYNRLGQPCKVWRQLEMPRVPDYVLSMVVYLYEDKDFAKDGCEYGGSGFLISMPCESGQSSMRHVYVVTNEHVVRNAPTCRITTARGGTMIWTPDKWHTHPSGDDLAVAYVGRYNHIDQQSLGYWVPYETIADNRTINQLHIGIGDEIYWAGRFIPIDGDTINAPVLRFGHISSMPRKIPQRDRAGFMQESFILETWSYSGYSGSPVFVYSTEFNPPFGAVYLLGINWGHTAELEETPQFQAARDLNTGMMLAVPAWCLRNILESEEMKAKRKAETDKAKSPSKKMFQAATDSAKKKTDLERFSDLAKKLAQVPKSEIEDAE